MAKRRRELTAEELTCLKVFADANGRQWKSALRLDWMRARAVPQLQALRNSHGPMWLNTFKFPIG